MAQAMWAETCTKWDDWDKPGPPFQVHANTYYVGTCGISAILITADAGHILIDSGTQAGADVVIDNIQSLGFKLNDIKWLLHSHEHFDHVGGMAQLQQLTNAKLLASQAAAPVLQSGISANNDPQSGMHQPFPAAQVDGQVQAGKDLVLGSITLTPIDTPGHSPGALSWQWQSCQASECLHIVYADSLSPISADAYRFSDHPEYVKSYQQGLHQLGQLECDIILAPHPSASGMRDKLLGGTGLVNSAGCEQYAQTVAKRLQQRLVDEQQSDTN
ncbi:subclass B3 metallo-beta-lactamase [Marinicella sp. X102]|nr:subclass B3 metallo-beta-lactamase [Marinicella marina]